LRRPVRPRESLLDPERPCARKLGAPIKSFGDLSVFLSISLLAHQRDGGQPRLFAHVEDAPCL